LHTVAPAVAASPRSTAAAAAPVLSSRVLPYAAMPDQQDIDDDKDPFKGMNLASAACIPQSTDANLVSFADKNSQRLSFVLVFRSNQ
jgi:hypothetical protein